MIGERGLNAEVWWKCEFFLSLNIPYESPWENNLYLSAWWGDGTWRWEQRVTQLCTGKGSWGHLQGDGRWACLVLTTLPVVPGPRQLSVPSPLEPLLSLTAYVEGSSSSVLLAKLCLRGSGILLTGFHPSISPCERHHYLSHLTTKHQGSKDTIPFQICWN